MFDNVERREVSNGWTEKAAIAEAARLNVAEPKRAEPVTRWAVISAAGQIDSALLFREKRNAAEWAGRAGARIARVEIREIEE